jgi:hypothetical protein
MRKDNRPQRGSELRKEPIKNPNDINAIKALLKDNKETLGLALF